MLFCACYRVRFVPRCFSILLVCGSNLGLVVFTDSVSVCVYVCVWFPPSFARGKDHALSLRSEGVFIIYSFSLQTNKKPLCQEGGGGVEGK